MLAFEIPSTRAFMHLDTVFTQVDVDKFTVHPGILGTLRIFELTGRGQGNVTTRVPWTGYWPDIWAWTGCS